ncbi:MAG: DUF3806 domain-containing protein [Granulosicoccus sp.]
MEDTAKFSALNDELYNWVNNQLLLLIEYARSLGISLNEPLDPKRMDELWLVWRNAQANDSDAVDSFLNCFGIGFGQILVNRLGFEWTYMEDEYGADIAVRALPEIADVRIAPLHFVLKRWESNEGVFIEFSLNEINRVVDESAREHGVER